MLMVKTMASPLGELHLYARGDALVAVHLPTPTPPPPGEVHAAPVLERAAAQLAEYFRGERVVFELPLGAIGTRFQQRVWRALTTIPFGETRSYGAIADAIGHPSASRAVGAANGRNPIAIIVPCHRVIGANGTLTGYAGGMAAKQWLLEHERPRPVASPSAQLSLLR